MSSSTNRYAALGEASRSNEQEAQVPNTGTPDQTMGDASLPDAPVASIEPVSLTGLAESLPKVLTKEESTALFLERFNKWQDDEWRKKSRQGPSTSTFVGQLIPSANPTPIDMRRDTATRPLDCKSIINPRRTYCAFRYEDDNGGSTGTVGNLWAATKGWSCQISVDAGRYGAPKITLHLRVNKGNKALPLSQNASEYFQCDVTWRAGITIDQQPVIEALRSDVMMRFAETQQFPYNSSITDSCPEKRQSRLPNVIAMQMTCHSTKTDQIEDEWLEGLPDHERALLWNTGTHNVTLWFEASPSSQLAYHNWIRHLDFAVNSKQRAFWKYLNAEGRPEYEIRKVDPIHTFNDGMYVKNRSAKADNENNKGAKRSASTPSAPDETKRFHVFDRELSWEVDYECGVYNTIPVIRGVQFQESQVAHLATRTQLIHLVSIPRMKSKGTAARYTPKPLEGVFKGFVRMTTPDAAPDAGFRI